MNQNPKRISGLYAVTPDTADQSDLLLGVEAALMGGARMIQYRNKSLAASNAGIDVRKHLEMAAALAKLCRQYGDLFIVNDDADLALDVGADGVHLGSSDGDIAAARKLLGADAVIGVSCYNSLSLALEAEAAGANYVAFGSMFASTTKPQAPSTTLELLHQAKKQLAIPVVAIGGITLHNAADVVQAGAHAVAVINAVFAAPDIAQAAREFTNLFQSESL
jgi:thiamine-phosphate pyrophosphorylase